MGTPGVSRRFYESATAVREKSVRLPTQKNVDERPLTRLLKCNDCDGYMVGYKNNKKDLHYYRCLKCRGVSVNAKTTTKARRKGAEDLFVEFLEQFQANPKLLPLIEMQLKKIFDHYNSGNANDEKELQKQLTILGNQAKQLKIRFGLNNIDKETYELTLGHLNSQIHDINKELNSENGTISNLEKLISASLKKLGNLSKIWGSSDLEGKRLLHKSIFPEGIFYNVKKHEYLTRKINTYVELVSSLSKSCDGNEKGNNQNSFENSLPVAGSGVEPETFGL